MRNKNFNGFDVAVDFDGTVVFHEYPDIGQPVPKALDILKRLQVDNHIILNTMRGGKELEDAVQWFKQNGINLYGINNNPTQSSWTSSPKVYAQFYIDDAAIGCPLLHDLHSRPCVDWEKIEKYLIVYGVLDV